MIFSQQTERQNIISWLVCITGNSLGLWSTLYMFQVIVSSNECSVSHGSTLKKNSLSNKWTPPFPRVDSRGLDMYVHGHFQIMFISLRYLNFKGFLVGNLLTIHPPLRSRTPPCCDVLYRNEKNLSFTMFATNNDTVISSVPTVFD